MRAPEVLAHLPDAIRNRLARRLQVRESNQEALLRTMRQPGLSRRILGACDHPTMREDVVLLCANPFDPIEPDELFDPDAFVQLGLIARPPHQADYLANLDMTLTMLPELPLEFGFSATLLARLPRDRRAALARDLSVGPRPTDIDLILDLAHALVQPESVQQRLALLTEEDRLPITTALNNAELPEPHQPPPVEGPLPKVDLDASAAGRVGLVFRVTSPVQNTHDRTFVPLELLEALPSWLQLVPPAPEPSGRTPRRRRPTTMNRRRDTLERALPPELLPGLGTQSDPIPAHSPPTKLLRAAALHPTQAVVDLESAEHLAVVRTHPQLRAGILQCFSDRWVVLRPDTDPTAWSEACAKVLRWPVAVEPDTERGEATLDSQPTADD